MQQAAALEAIRSHRPALLCEFYFVDLVSFIMTATRNSPGYPSKAVRSSYDNYYANLTKIYFVACWLVRANLSRDSGFSSKIGTIPSYSGRLDTLQGF